MWLLAIGLGAATGGLARAALSLATEMHLGSGWPWGTLIANVAGSFLMGYYATLTGPGGRRPAGPFERHFVLAGFCGGFTTFSIFSLETLRLLDNAGWPAAAASVLISLSLWFLAVVLGYLAAARSNARIRHR